MKNSLRIALLCKLTQVKDRTSYITVFFLFKEPSHYFRVVWAVNPKVVPRLDVLQFPTNRLTF